MDIEVKRKPKTKKQTPVKGREQTPLRDQRIRTACWVMGILFLGIGLYMLSVETIYLFNWQVESMGSGATGAEGSWLARVLVSDGFGLFALLVPFMVLVVSYRFFSRSFKLYDHTLIVLGLLIILGSLTLGAALGTKAEMFNSGWGGAIGLEMSSLLYKSLGTPGVVISLVVAWILVLVFINIRVIEIINNIGVGIAHKSKNIVGKVATSIKHAPAEPSVEVVPAPVAEPTPAPEIAPEPEVEPEVEPETEPTPEPEPEIEVIPEVVPVAEEPEQEEQPEVNAPLVVEVIDPEGDSELTDADAEKHRVFNPDATRNYHLPLVELLDERDGSATVSDQEIEENTLNLKQVLADFKISIINVTATTGPTVTLYEVELDRGVKVARVEGLSKEIAQALKASSVRVTPIPERGTVGIEVPNRKPAIVSMRSSLCTERFMEFKGELPIVVGRNIQNECIVFDLAKMPHLLVAGATGTGKSVGLNVILTSLLYRKDPSQLKLVLIDPKQVEFSLYEGLANHFLARMESEEDNIVIDAQKAVFTLHSLCYEMEERLKKCRLVGTRNIKEYNDLVRQCKIESREIMPYIVVVIDEYADLVTQSKLVEVPVMRLAAKARAAGIHLILATQRPSVDIITGRIKTNFPARIAFRVSSRVDSGTIIDQPGAQSLIGMGDMLFKDSLSLTRVQCAFVDTPEVKRIVDYISTQPSPTGMPYALPDYEDGGASASMGSGSMDDGGAMVESGAPVRYDALFAEIARDAVSGGDNFSVSYIQRTYEVGFVRAGRIMLQLERAGIVGPQVPGAKSRDVRITDPHALEAKLQELGLS